MAQHARKPSALADPDPAPPQVIEDQLHAAIADLEARLAWLRRIRDTVPRSRWAEYAAEYQAVGLAPPARR